MKPVYRYLALALFATATAAGAQNPPQGGNGGEQRRGPPPEAIDACKGKAASATCTFTNREGEKMTGTCFAPPAKAGDQTESRPMACRPDRGGKNGPGPGKGSGD
jgi:hypothetical protein